MFYFDKALENISISADKAKVARQVRHFMVKALECPFEYFERLRTLFN